ncbi:hypothetical protein Rleg2_4237 [Rhizobium leguminosarum bv. trifolii WSM2304]|uniref:Uncharacterized protein n=1 Tax=Rhizobium leguminosarum bv. trifolii (strain WSM2304) TaxID=395492 RepID=A0ABF7QT22_RHILW|nr:hypothetical protein [Rhizobium leguminosarum]ACI57498.1 hypothetical protein Rleg2_4237 [Rhizobium leguminosarum bv. trifolii WSM2304]
MADKPTLTPIQLRPAASTPSRTMVQPERLETNPDKIQNFLSEIGKLQPTLQQFGQAAFEAKHDPQAQADEQSRAEFEAMGKDSNAIGEQMKSGAYTPKTVQALGARQGFVAANEAHVAILKAYGESADPASFDQNAAIASARDQFRQRFGNNATAMRYFEQGLADLPARLQANKTDTATKNFVQQRDLTLAGAFDAAMSQTKDPKAMGAIVRQMVKENTDFIHASPADQAALLQGLVVKAGDNGDVDKVNVLGDIDLGAGPLKNIMGQVYQNAQQRAANVTEGRVKEEFQTKLFGWMQSAQTGSLTEEQKKEATEFSEAHPKVFTAAGLNSIFNTQAAALKAQSNALSEEQRANAKDIVLTQHSTEFADAVQKGSIKSAVGSDVQIKLDNGKTATVPRKEIIASTIKANAEVAKQNAIASTTGSDAEKQEAGIDAYLEVYTKNDELPDDLADAAKGVLSSSRADDEPTLTQLSQAHELIRIATKAPGLIDTIIKSDKDRAFVDSLTVSAQRKIDPKVALKRAIADRDNYDATVPLDRKTESEAVQTVIDGLKTSNDGWGPFNWFASEGGSNESQLKALALKTVRQLYRGGRSAEEVADIATKRLKANVTNFNGQSIDMTGLPISKPGSAAPMFEAARQKLLETGRFKGVDPKTLSFQRVGNTDRFVVVSSDGILTHTLSTTFQQLFLMYKDVHEREEKNKNASALAAGVQRTINQDRMVNPPMPLDIGGFGPSHD